MARLRTSLSNAINDTKEQINKKNITIEEAAHNSALTFNENEQEIINKVKLYMDKESRKTGKVGRPSKKIKDKNMVSKANVSNKSTKKQSYKKNVADTENIKTDNIKKSPYVFSGEVSFKNMGVENKLYVTIPTNEVDIDKAKDFVLNYFYTNNLMVFISNKELEKNLKNL